MSPAVLLLRDLIALPSVNPGFLPGHEPFTGEKRVADFLAAHLARAGLDIDFHEALPGRANLLARLAPRGPMRQRILLAPHLDTVGGDPLPGQLFTPVFQRGRLHGRGACDTKGSIAMAVTALCAVAKTPNRPQTTEILFVGFVDEEKDQMGSRKFVEAGHRADLAIVGEPTRLEAVTTHKGDLWFAIETRGQAAHGACPELGRNAVHEMARLVDFVLTKYARRLRRQRHAVLGHPTISVGTIQGGTQPNIVPDRCVITVDRRTLPGEHDGEVKRELAELLAANGFSARITDTKAAPSHPMEMDLKQPLVKKLLNCLGQTGAVGVDYFSDAGVLAAGGIPSVLFGPGDIAQAHTADEWIEVKQLEKGVDLLLHFLRQLP